MKVFLAGTSLLPRYGGPALSVSRLARALVDAGAEVGLWAPDQSAAMTPFLPADSYVRRIGGNAVDALNSFGKIDVIHDNGLWLPHNHRLASLAKKRKIPRVVSTRGMLEPWAMRYKQWKKSIAWRLYQRHDLKRAQCHHSTSDQEARNVQQLGLRVPVRMIPNGVDLPKLDLIIAGRKGWKVDGRGPRTALFLGRICPIKGLPMLIEAWARVRPKGWVLRIAGPDERGHRSEVERAVANARLSDVVLFMGPIDGQTRQSAYIEADFFVLPTYSENFGMSIAEALAHGLPVLTTTGAPWSILPHRGCGWWVDATVDGIAEGLQQATSRDSLILQTMGMKGRQLVEAEFGWDDIAEQFLKTYEELLTK